MIAYFGVLAGAFLEGEITIITAMIAVHLGHLTFPGVVGMALIGVQLTDWFHFLLGRYFGKSFIEKRPKLEKKINKVNHWIDKHPYKILLSYRFLYGFRTVLPVAIGISNISIARFGIFSLFSGLVWVSLYATLGYYLGEMALQKFEYLKANSLDILFGLIIFAGLVALVRIIILRRRLQRLRNRVE